MQQLIDVQTVIKKRCANKCRGSNSHSTCVAKVQQRDREGEEDGEKMEEGRNGVRDKRGWR